MREDSQLDIRAENMCIYVVADIYLFLMQDRFFAERSTLYLTKKGRTDLKNVFLKRLPEISWSSCSQRCRLTSSCQAVKLSSCQAVKAVCQGVWRRQDKTSPVPGVNNAYPSLQKLFFFLSNTQHGNTATQQTTDADTNTHSRPPIEEAYSTPSGGRPLWKPFQARNERLPWPILFQLPTFNSNKK